MLTSTVKEVSERPQPRKIEPVLLIMFQQFANLFLGSRVRIGARELLFSACGLLLLGGVANVHGQTLRAHISVVSVDPGRVKIEAELPDATGTLSFRNTYAGVLGLGERIEKLEASRANGESVQVNRLAPGEYQSTEKFARVRYEVNLAEPSRPAQMSHVSWLNREHGLLMLMDLLPVTTRSSSSGSSSAVVEVDVPAGWTVAANAKKDGARFSTEDPENAVFLIGPKVREKTESFGAINFSIISSGKWPFSEKDALKTARQVVEEYSTMTQFALKRNAVLMLVPFPADAGPQSWSAETRGNAVVLLLGRKASGKRVLSRLGILLSHELFHLWVPNSLNLAGNYDWFFEGFTLYQALRTDLHLGLITFEGYLETIARVYDSYSSSPDRDRLSLIEASERRWTTSSSLVYDKGMLVALMIDLTLRKRSDCSESLDGVYRELFRVFRSPGSPAAGQLGANETIIGILNTREGLAGLVKDYVEGVSKMELDATFASYGIQVQQGSAGTKLVVARDLNPAQRKLLGCIGYQK
jgi:predicted metalloprotease with PDZ domain